MRSGGKNINPIEHKAQLGNQGLIVIRNCMKEIEMTHKVLITIFLLSTALLGCTGVPKGLEPVSGFDGDRYLGRWYEIARLDHSF